MPFPRAVLAALARSPGRTAFEHQGRQVSCEETLTTVRRIAAGMRRAGVSRGDQVAMVVSLTPEAFAAHVAAYSLGCVVVGVRPGWSEAHRAAVLDEVDAIVVDSATVTGGLPEIAHPAAVLSIGDFQSAEHDLLTTPDDGLPITVEARDEDFARVNFTSGTSGRPKGCMWTYEALHPAFERDHWPAELARLISHFDRFLAFGTWAMPAMFTFAARSLLIGGTVVIAEGARHDVPYAIERHRITGAVMPMHAVRPLLDVLQAYEVDVSSLWALVVTGSLATPQLLADAIATLGPIVWQGYGQSESGMISLLTPDDIARSPESVLDSVGRVLPHVEVGICDPDGGPVRPGEIGRILIRSPQTMAGYWGDAADETSEVLQDGWLDTRDLGRLTPEGFLQLTGRARDVIMVSAHVVYAAPIERVLAAQPDIDQAYVIGAPDGRTGEAIHAFVVPRQGRRPHVPHLAALVGAELGTDSVPETITVIDGVPLNRGGKPDKNALLRYVPVR